MKALVHYLRVHRMHAGFSQEELGYLLGFSSGATVSRHERKVRDPSLRLAFMYQIIFGAVPSELFPRFFTLIEEETIRRVYELHQKLSGKLSKKNQAKLQVLNDALARASSRLNDLAI